MRVAVVAFSAAIVIVAVALALRSDHRGVRRAAWAVVALAAALAWTLCGSVPWSGGCA